MLNKDKMKQLAEKHSKRMFEEYSNSIQKATKDTKMYSPLSFSHIKETKNKLQNEAKISVVDCTTTRAAFNLADEGLTDIALLNFASYKYPGGGFMTGSVAQEEALCHESFLYNVLSNFEERYYVYNRKNLNRGLYTNRALYSPNILFECNNKINYFSVITCAAPNFKVAAKYQNVTEEENKKAVKERIEFIFYIAMQNHIKNLILGAWGCGVFGQDPKTVAELFFRISKKYRNYFENIIFAIPNGKNGNYCAFKNVFRSLNLHENDLLDISFKKAGITVTTTGRMLDDNTFRDFCGYETIIFDDLNISYRKKGKYIPNKENKNAKEKSEYNLSREYQAMFVKFLLDNGMDEYGYVVNSRDKTEIFETDEYIVRPYQWGSDEQEANFEYKPDNVKIWWYKYPLRGAVSNVLINEEYMKKILRKERS